MSKRILASLAVLGLMTAPALAAPVCSGSYALDMDWHTEAELNDYHLSELRARGVNATRAEIWSGCVRAFVLLDNGTEEMQFFEPLGMRRVQ